MRYFLVFATLLWSIGCYSTANADTSITTEEMLLYKLVNEYRAENGLPAIPLSVSLTYVAQTHVKDLQNYPPTGNCNMHSWSANGTWSACCYTPDHAQSQCMWDKPRELTKYSGNGYENAFGGSGGYEATASSALEGWKHSSGHNAVILNQGNWQPRTWNALGVGIYGGYAVLWFGEEIDPVATGTTVSPNTPVNPTITTLDWKTSKSQAMSAARSQNKLVLLVAGRDECGNTNYTRTEALPSEPLSSLAQEKFILWYSNVDTSTEYYNYSSGLNEYILPLIAVIDPNQENKYLARITGYQKTDYLYTWLKSAATNNTTVPASSNEGFSVTDNIWINAKINTVEKGLVNAVWQKGGDSTTARGDRVIWGYFYASPADVGWGNKNNPDMFVKIWFDASGRIDVNYFHVSVPEVEVYSSKKGGTVLTGTATMDKRYVLHSYNPNNTQTSSAIDTRNASVVKIQYPSGKLYDTWAGGTIQTVEKGSIESEIFGGGGDETARGDYVSWGYFYASSEDVSWGSIDNPEVFIKVWFDVSGRVDVNFFHVSVPDILVQSLAVDEQENSITSTYESTVTMNRRYARHEYSPK